MKIKDDEHWDVKCVDQFEKYHKNLTKDEIEAIQEIRDKIFNRRTRKSDIEPLYAEAIAILHNAWTRRTPAKKHRFRERNEDEEEEGIAYFGVSEAWE